MDISRKIALEMRDIEADFGCTWNEPDREAGFSGGWACDLTSATLKANGGVEVKLSRDQVLDLCGDLAVQDAEFDAEEYADRHYGKNDDEAA